MPRKISIIQDIIKNAQDMRNMTKKKKRLVCKLRKTTRSNSISDVPFEYKLYKVQYLNYISHCFPTVFWLITNLSKDNLNTTFHQHISWFIYLIFKVVWLTKSYLKKQYMIYFSRIKASNSVKMINTQLRIQFSQEVGRS